ncbi:glycogen debranching protein GlgX [Sedimentitalea todarodis]|uniref:Glycogen debranching protein GlgX n=1 Tax=Sedimentitalea todarodis TaxID=1631240 RepID=A0ABU3VIT5_9RHOB|nr:glycogen debranching protein GlgX [Sedimentitalea todarodis]MDU9006096.1 glycogen debranching protein GlgX [Sedimentitalea todarodis]
MTKYRLTRGLPNPLGARHDGNGVNFAVFSENANAIDLCIFSEDGETETTRLALPERTGPVWHGYLEGLPVGTRYGYRAHGPYDPERGQRFNPNKLLLDPYARELHGTWGNDPAMLGYEAEAPTADLSFDTRDSAPFVPKSVVSDPAFFAPRVKGGHKAGARDLIYEAHPKGLTQLHPDVPEALRGTYEGLASDVMIAHFKQLGVGAVELLPVHAFVDDSFLVDRALRNYWGYNSIGFFTPEPRYFGPDGMAGFRRMVDRLHENEIEVILDVVYNHTAEGDQSGPTLSFRGLDNASYYRLSRGQPRYYVNDTGCGNTLNIGHPYVLRLVLDSLRFWVEAFGIDGFRFDLATVLGREDHGFDPSGRFFAALRQDPVLADVRMIAEPWDIGPGGYQLGAFPHEFREWNDGFRDSVRRYWRDDDHAMQNLGGRLLGSAENFDHSGRRSWTSVNFLAAHDGFTLADTTRYARRHNEANGEMNRDGHGSNFSDNCGVEGETDDPVIIARRKQRQRNMLATLFLAQGTPMLLSGDEISNSQEGNNNAYCQDNETGWVSWDEADKEMCAFVAHLSAFRGAHGAVRQTRFLHGAKRPHDGLLDVEWSDFSGGPVQWRDPRLANVCLTLRCSADAPDYESGLDTVFVAFNRSDDDLSVVLPDAPPGMIWVREIETSKAAQTIMPVGEDLPVVGARSVSAFVLVSAASA